HAVLEIWEYNWTVGISWWGEVHPKSYIVRFESDDTLASWREPLKAEQDDGGKRVK
ncbi:unnamed protein product, partial [marine sediment metagenome]